ncbi:MAG TPA: hypothetical protein VH012_09410 [Acidimicrobiales bacterium]|nr:hypothetical protein [Acidimicrobiales bacterium]
MPCLALLLTLAATTPAGAHRAPPALSTSLKTLAGAKDQATGVSCPAHGSCIAVDFTGDLYMLSGNRGALLASTGFDLFAVSCPTTTFCAAVGTDGAVVFLPTRTWTYPLFIRQPLDEVHWQSISCPSQSFCMAGGGIFSGPNAGAGVVAQWNGLVWTPLKVIDPDVPSQAKNQISTMSCSGPKFCVAGDGNGRTLQWDGTKWFFPRLLNLPDIVDSFAVSCSSSSFCVALGADSSEVVMWNGTKWRYHSGPSFVDGYGVVSCPSSKYCVAVSEDGEASSWSGRAWSRVQKVDPTSDDFFNGISCSPAGFCEAVTSEDHFVYLHDRGRTPKLPVLCARFACEGTRL